MPCSAQLQSLNMNNIMLYIVYSKHDAFVTMLIVKMLDNVCEYYAKFPHVVETLQKLRTMLEEQSIPYEVCVIIFFFFLCIDMRMRHWILDTALSPEDAAFRKKCMQKHIELIPNARGYLQPLDRACFLGQRATFAALDPHTAVGILLPMSSECFFEDICNGGDIDAFRDTYARIKLLVACA